MPKTDRILAKIHFPPRGLLMQLITIVLLPLTLILLAITFGSIAIHQNAMRGMVGERDQRTISTAAEALSAQVDLRSRELQGLAQVLEPGLAWQSSANLPKIEYLQQDFDLGLGILGEMGKLSPFDSQNPVAPPIQVSQLDWGKIYPQLITQPGRLVVTKSVDGKAHVGLISAQSADHSTLLVGALSIERMAAGALQAILPASGEMSIFLVEQGGELLYQSGDAASFTPDHQGVAEALQGQTGTAYVKHEGDEHVTAYSPVPATGWALVSEEPWQSVATPALRATQFAPLALVPALLVMSLALWLGARQIIQPLRNLESRSASLASGDFSSIHEPVGGIAEIQHLQGELADMASKVQEAQRSLHKYIGSITAAQEDERRRLARELHDDTLQALIALKQRVQLAQLELQPAVGGTTAEAAELGEIAGFTEQTIENLRRLTRALRPIYLEDLGLVAALEMLCRETSQVSGINVEFERQGSERRLEGGIELALYRMAQEALNNIAHHSGASAASVTIRYAVDSIQVTIEDNGSGFTLPANLAEFANRGHYGLLGLHERAELLGATLELVTAPGKGTRIGVTLPV